MDVTVAPLKQNLNSKGTLISYTLNPCDFKTAVRALNQKQVMEKEAVTEMLIQDKWKQMAMSTMNT